MGAADSAGPGSSHELPGCPKELQDIVERIDLELLDLERLQEAGFSLLYPVGVDTCIRCARSRDFSGYSLVRWCDVVVSLVPINGTCERWQRRSGEGAS